MFNTIIQKLKLASPWRLLGMAVLSSELLAAFFVSLMSLFLHGRIRSDFLITSAAAALPVSILVASVLIRMIAARQRAERAVETEGDITKKFIDNSPSATFVVNPRHQVIFWNKACEELTGIPSASMVGTNKHWVPFYAQERQTLADVIIDGNREDLPALYDIYSRSTLNPNGLQAEGWKKDLNGVDRYLIYDAAPIYNAGGELTAVVETLHDHTDQKRLEEESAKRESLFRTIINTEPECVLLVSADGVIQDMNPAGLAMFEAGSPEQLVGSALVALVAPEYRPAVEEHCKQVFQGATEAIEYEIIGLKGSRRRLECRTAPIRDGAGAITALLGVARDITEHKQWETALQEQFRFLQLLIDTMPMPVFYKDLKGVYRGCNKAFEDFLGLEKEKLIGKTVYDVAPKDLADEYYRRDKDLFDDPGIQVYEFGVKHADGTQHDVIFNKATYTDVNGNTAGLLGVMQDITERKRAEQVIQWNYDSQTVINWILHISLENITLDSILKQALNLILSVSRLSFEAQGCIYLVEGDPPKLVMKARRGPACGIAEECKTVPFGVCLCGRAAASGEVQFSDMLDHHHEVRHEDMVPHGHYCVPIKYAREVLGVLNVYLKDGHRRDQKEIESLNAIASALAGIIRRKRVEEAMQESEKRYRTLAEEARDAIFILDREGRFQYINSFGAELFQRTPQELVGTDLTSVLPAPISQQQQGDLQNVFVTGTSVYEEGRYVFGDKEVWLGTRLAPLRTEDGAIYAVQGISRDITDMKHSEEEREKLIHDIRTALNAASRSQKEWLDTFDSITEMIVIIDNNGNIVKANRAFSSHLGLQPRDIIHLKYDALLEKSGLPSLILTPDKTGTLPESEEIFNAGSNEIFRVSVFPYYSPDGEHLGSIHIARDITAEKEKEMRLVMSERLAALGQMASGIAHEINNPLASIAGCSEGLLTRVRKGRYDSALFESYLNIIQEEVFRCKNITTTMLSFVRNTTYEKKDILLHELLDKTIEVIGFQGRLKNVEITKRYSDRPLTLHGSEGELRQLFLVIIANALDAMEDEGALTVETSGESERVVVRIRDTGPGIPFDLITKMFEPFFTTKADQGGTGLGLSIARKIVLNHGGTIDADSEQDKGALITITFPS